GPCPATRRPCCRPERRQNTTSDCAARARRRSRTRDPSVRSKSQAAPPYEYRHWHLQEVREQRDAEEGHDGRENDRAEPRRGFVTKRGDKDAHECAGDHSEVASEENEEHRAQQNAKPCPPLRVLGQDALDFVIALRRKRDRRDG